MPKNVRMDTRQSASLMDSELRKQWRFQCVTKGVGEVWLIDSNDYWIWRFHRDQKGWINEPKVFIDRGHRLPDGPPLLNERRHL